MRRIGLTPLLGRRTTCPVFVAMFAAVDDRGHARRPCFEWVGKACSGKNG